MQPNQSDLPPQAQQMIGELQKQKQQLQQIGQQKRQFQAEQKRLERALEALDDADEDKEVVKVTGPVGIKSSQDELVEEFTEKKDQIESKLESIEEKEENLKQDAMQKQNKLQEMMSGGQGPQSG